MFKEKLKELFSTNIETLKNIVSLFDIIDIALTVSNQEEQDTLLSVYGGVTEVFNEIQEYSNSNYNTIIEYTKLVQKSNLKDLDSLLIWNKIDNILIETKRDIIFNNCVSVIKNALVENRDLTELKEYIDNCKKFRYKNALGIVL